MNNTDRERDMNEDIYSQANPLREGFTRADQKHMYRLGKVQALKVCRFDNIHDSYRREDPTDRSSVTIVHSQHLVSLLSLQQYGST